MIMSDQLPAPNCDDLPERLLPIDEAMQRIVAAIEPLTDRVRLNVRSALGHVLAEDIFSPNDVPMHTNSAMDGYAVAADCLPVDGNVTLEVVGISWAGKAFKGSVKPGQCVRIMTGAVVPPDTDTVIMQEQASVSGDTIKVPGGHRKGNNVRYAGEDLPAGSIALRAGHRISPADLGLLASVGVGEVNCLRRPRVAFFSTGDELKSVGQQLELGDVYDSNRYTLFGMLTRMGCEPVDMGVVPDDADATREAFISGARAADMLITSAGASVGDADFVQSTLNEIGQVTFWKMAMKPGRPLAFGNVSGTPFFGLPGNPVSVMVTFYQFVRPALQKLSGEQIDSRLKFQARTITRVRKRPGRAEFQRGHLRQNSAGELEVENTGDQGSGILSSMSVSNCFIVLDAEQGSVEAGDWVTVEPFAGLI
ncbi:MAG: molybdopterin molybdotransferase [Parasphingorhabdus sp.]|jgi:molybdopterin molybdotransferase